MRKIINGKMYDTEKAECLGSYDNGNYRNHCSFYEAELYKRRKAIILFTKMEVLILSVIYM